MRLRFLALALAAGLSAMTAKADTSYNFTYTGTNSYSITGSVDVNDGIIVGITGLVNGSDVITGLAPLNTDGSDNEVYGLPPYLDGDGVSFNTLSGGLYNLYYSSDNSDYEIDASIDSGGNFNTVSDGTVSIVPSVAATPEPSSIALLGTGLLGVAGATRRRFVRS